MLDSYYEGGRRVVIDGVPCKVFSRPMSRETSDLKARLALVLAGEIEWEPMESLPGFTYTAPAKGSAKAAKSPSPAVKVSKAAKAYYDGGHRLVIGGVPVRVARKPGKTTLLLMRQTNPFAPTERRLPMRADSPSIADREAA
ncbi:MAG TPA: hypothetical protein VGW40_02835 [Allosphingosinicella sp.]|nr:hypothetical protein [Allosphingosinicella sp.]